MIANLHLRLRLERRGDALAAVLDAHRADGWHAVLERVALGAGCAALGDATVGEPQLTITGGARSLSVALVYAHAALHCAFLLRDDQPWLQVVESLALDADGEAAGIDRLRASWRFAAPWSAAGEVWTPHLAPEEGDVIGRHVLRSPALTAQSGANAAALVIDADALAKEQALPGCAEFAREADGTPLMTCGLRRHRPRGHVFFRADDAPAHAPVFHHAYHLWASAEAAPGAALAAAGAFCWQGFGSRAWRGRPAGRLLPEHYAERIYDHVLPARWRETTIAGERVGAVALDASYRGDAWFSAWWNSLASAYGMFHWGERLARPEWRERALAVRRLALAAPDDDGLFPTIYVFPDDRRPGRWIGSSQQGGGVGVLHLMDMSWTMWWLLRFHADLAGHPATIARAKRYVAALMRLQRADGGLPAWVAAGTHEPLIAVDTAQQAALLAADAGGDHLAFRLHGLRHAWESRRFVASAEDAASLLCAVELARQLPADDADRPRLIAFASGVARWLERFAFPAGRWLDFEVAYSCAPKAHDTYDHRTGQWPQNNLCLDHAARGLLGLHRLTGDTRWLALGRRALDRLQLGQQVWNPPFLAIDALGGYGVQNGDAEWHDARQAQFAWTHLDWHEATGEAAQRERAEAAIRAAFTTVFDPGSATAYPTGWFRAPRGMAAENHAHEGRDQTCCVSGWDWGAGSALTAAARMERGDRPHGAASGA